MATTKEQERMGKLVDILYESHERMKIQRNDIEHLEWQNDKCHDYIRHLSHELDVVKNVKKPMGEDEIKGKLRDILQANTGDVNETFFSEVECISAFIEAHFEEKKPPEATHPPPPVIDAGNILLFKADEGFPMEMLSWSAGQLSRFAAKLEQRIKELEEDGSH
jgi:hypothetical protein